jgi:type IV pilus assembly protein PilC
VPQFYYEGKKISGEMVKGTIDADTDNDVQVALRRQSIFPTKIVKEGGSSSKSINIKLFEPKVKSKDLAIFCRQFSTIISAGISVVECVDILRKQTENKRLKQALNEVYEDVQKGLTLSASMRKFKNVFPEMLVNMVAAGEVSGALDIIMNRMMTHYDKEHKLNQKIQGAMVYPILLIFFSFAVSYILLAFVLPTFIDMFVSMGVTLPAPTRFLIKISHFLNQFWYIFILIIFLTIYFFRRSLATTEGKMKFDAFKLYMPVIGPVNQKVATARFSRSLATMLSSGITILEAIELVTKVLGNQALSQKILESTERLKKGEGISGPLSQIKAFPPMMISMIRIGEETGALDKMLESTADFYDEEVSFAVDKMVALINPLILLVMAGVVSFIVMSVALPMFDIVNIAQGTT